MQADEIRSLSWSVLLFPYCPPMLAVLPKKGIHFHLLTLSSAYGYHGDPTYQLNGFRRKFLQWFRDKDSHQILGHSPFVQIRHGITSFQAPISKVRNQYSCSSVLSSALSSASWMYSIICSLHIFSYLPKNIFVRILHTFVFCGIIWLCGKKRGQSPAVGNRSLFQCTYTQNVLLFPYPRETPPLPFFIWPSRCLSPNFHQPGLAWADYSLPQKSRKLNTQ